MSSLKSEIKAANVKFMDAFGKGDMTAPAALFAPDCKLMSTGADVMTGRDKVGAVFQSVISAGGVKVELSVDEVGPLEGSGMDLQMVYERSHYTFYKADGSVFDAGKYVVIWKKMMVLGCCIPIYLTPTSLNELINSSGSLKTSY